MIDLLNGQAVHAVGGRRAYYQPIQSILHASSEPIPLARALRDSLGLQTLYLADLDAIAGCPPRLDIVSRRSLTQAFTSGSTPASAMSTSLAPLLELDPASSTIIAGLETVRRPTRADRHRGTGRSGPGCLQSGPVRRTAHGSPRRRPGGPKIRCELAEAAIECGVRHLLILDLARVGTGRGLGTSDLIESDSRRPSLGSLHRRGRDLSDRRGRRTPRRRRSGGPGWLGDSRRTNRSAGALA